MKVRKHRSKAEKSTSSTDTIKGIGESLLTRLESFFESNKNIIASIILLINVLFAFALFDVKISEANDDSLYVEGAYNFAKDYRNYFSANAPLYPMILSIPIKLFGLNIIILKFFSLLFSALHVFFLYKAFSKRVPYTVLFSMLAIVSVNSYFQYFASQTFTESFFLMVQALMIWAFVKVIENERNDQLKYSWKNWLHLGLMVFIATLSKNLATVTVVAGIFYFLIYKQWKQIAYFLSSFILVRLVYEGIRFTIWGAQNQFSSQSSIVLQKDPYDPSKGMETFDGFIGRLFDNLNIYLSKRFYQILGFISEDSQVA
ncbi:MAG TPA: glycosyltransferase family 39 protein, partial [Bacteroidia bacterium]|nr:glycosyltransferase family 39 protein [Bacteroidia bacterium]